MLQDISKRRQELVEAAFRGLAMAWTDFEGQLEQVPVIRKLNRGQLQIEDYRALLKNLRQQVVDGGCWIARAASHVDAEHFEIRSHFMKHAVTEHRDFQMLEANFIACGGTLEEIRSGSKNMGAEALSAFMFHKASQPNPFGLLGAMFMIEGLGSRKAVEWGAAIKEQLGLQDHQVSFMLYHGEHDDDHLEELETHLAMTVHDEADVQDVVRTARIVGRLYALQLEELDHV